MSVEIPFQQWSGNAWQKESSIAYGAGYIHVAFSSIKLDPNKDNFYSLSPLKVIATPTPVPPRCTGQQFKDVCPGDYFYTEASEFRARNLPLGVQSVSAKPQPWLSSALSLPSAGIAGHLIAAGTTGVAPKGIPSALPPWRLCNWSKKAR